LALSVGVVLAVLSVVPWWITLAMVAGWFAKEYASVVREEQSADAPLVNRGR
jgi:phosphatidylglycerophosphate synthase